METFSALLAICAGNPPVTGEFPAQRPVTRSFDVLFCLLLNKRLSEQSRGWWFEMPSCPLWRNCNEQNVAIYYQVKACCNMIYRPMRNCVLWRHIKSLNFVVISPGNQWLVAYSYLKSNTFVLHSSLKLFENVANTLNFKWIYSAQMTKGYTQNGHEGTDWTGPTVRWLHTQVYLGYTETLIRILTKFWSLAAPKVTKYVNSRCSQWRNFVIQSLVGHVAYRKIVLRVLVCGALKQLDRLDYTWGGGY